MPPAVPQRAGAGESSQTVSHGHEGDARAFDAGRRPRASGLAHLPCVGPALDRARQIAVCPRPKSPRCSIWTRVCTRWTPPLSRRLPCDGPWLYGLRAPVFDASCRRVLCHARQACIDARCVYSSPTQRDTGVIRDHRIMLDGHYSAKAHPGWRAVATCGLIAIVKRELHLDASLYTWLQILSVSVFEKTEMSCALRPDRSQAEED